jgi:hypothetical protein
MSWQRVHAFTHSRDAAMLKMNGDGHGGVGGVGGVGGSQS